MNSVNLVGRLVSDPNDLKYTPSGVAVLSLRIAVDRRFKSESGEKQSDFFDVVLWRQSAEFAANYLSKGRLVAVSGRLQSRSWIEDGGTKRYKVEVVCDSIQGLDRAKEEAPVAETQAPSEDYPDFDPFSEE
jgi:single-strand DNA-binding protein